jgi:hypothetical protein
VQRLLSPVSINVHAHAVNCRQGRACHILLLELTGNSCSDLMYGRVGVRCSGQASSGSQQAANSTTGFYNHAPAHHYIHAIQHHVYIMCVALNS